MQKITRDQFCALSQSHLFPKVRGRGGQPVAPGPAQGCGPEDGGGHGEPQQVDRLLPVPGLAVVAQPSQPEAFCAEEDDGVVQEVEADVDEAQHVAGDVAEDECVHEEGDESEHYLRHHVEAGSLQTTIDYVLSLAHDELFII